jgi:hypothetical protein
MLKNLFISEVRINVLKLLLLQPEESYHVRAIVRAVGAEINAVRRELENLHGMNLVRRRQSSNKIFYQVNTSHMFYSDLISLLSKEEGIGAEIIMRAKDLGNIKFAMLAKPFLRGRESSPLEVDLFFVGEVRMDILEEIVRNFQRKTKKELNYSVLSEEEFLFRKRKNDHFIYKLLSQGRSMLIGDEEKFHSVV